MKLKVAAILIASPFGGETEVGTIAHFQISLL